MFPFIELSKVAELLFKRLKISYTDVAPTWNVSSLKHEVKLLAAAAPHTIHYN